MNVTLIDGSHKDRPRLDITASEVISDRLGTLILSPSIHPNYARINDPTIPTSISDLARACVQGLDLRLSHDWVVKVHN